MIRTTRTRRYRRAVAHAIAATMISTIAGASVPASAADAVSSLGVDLIAVDATLPTGTVTAGAVAVVTGRVVGLFSGDRLVQLESQGANGTWVPLAATTTLADGTFSVNAPTWWTATQTLRAYVPATSTSASTATTPGVTMTVSPTHVPRTGTAYTREFGAAARWNPCQPITYRINRHLMPSGARAALAKVLAQVSQATGLQFSYAGTTTYLPYATNAKTHPTDADIVLAWSTPAAVPYLAGSTMGHGGAAWASSGDVVELYDGAAVFDAAQRMSRKRAVERRLTRQLYLHEIGHVLGLDHVTDKRQLMYPVMQRSADAYYGAGDLAGLAALGASGGCNTTGAR